MAGMGAFRVRCWSVVSLLVFAGQAAGEKPLGDMTGSWQLFLDDHLVSSRTNVVRRYHPFRKHKTNPIMVADRPWEENVVSVNTVLPNEDGSGYRMWYYCWTPRRGNQRTATLYATSKDGIHWEKPELGLHEWDGSKANNIVRSGSSIMHTPWSSDPQRQYHSVTSGRYFAATSANGIEWQRLSAESIISGGDVGWFRYDPQIEKFRAYVKVNAYVRGLRRRAVGFSESADIASFPPLRLIMAPDDFDDRWTMPGTVQRAHFYGCPTFAYETMYVGMLWVFRAEDDEGYFHGPTYTELVTSRDGIHWLREEGDRPPILELGKPPRAWDGGMIAGMSLLRVGDELWLYYAGYDDQHDYLPFHAGVGLATLRKDGFASLDAGTAPGEVLTRRLEGVSGPLHVNCNGSLRVEVLDATGKPLPGYGRADCDEVKGNHVDTVVTWRGKSDLPQANGPVRLCFLLRNAQLYSFLAGDSVRVLDDDAGPVLQALYTFEAPPWEDKLAADGVQGLRALGTARPARDAEHVAFGSMAMAIGSQWRPLSRLEIADSTRLGKHFTLAAMVKSADNLPARLFSAYSGNRPPDCSELILDFDPRGKAPVGLRLYCKGIPVESEPVRFDDGKYHHLAVTYDDGTVRFYLDGKLAGQAWLPGGAPVTLSRNLLVGEDAELGSHEQLMGHVDDVLVLGRTLRDQEIAAIATKGGEALLVD
jgi:hypothetical protein